MAARTVSIALTGSGGAGVMTAGQILLDAAAYAGLYGIMGRSSGPQIRGGEAAAMVRLSTDPVASVGNFFDVLIAFDWGNVNRFAAELPLSPDSLILSDPQQGEIPPALTAYGATVVDFPLKDLAKAVPGGRPNMIGLGAAAALLGLPLDAFHAVIRTALERKGADVLQSGIAALTAGHEAISQMNTRTYPVAFPESAAPNRWNISGNEAAGLGALRAGVRFVAAYPITPATELLEWIAPNITRLGGTLLQAEDELASVNMALGASFGGIPSLTATAGPGLSLMMESLGLAVMTETPLTVIDVMRGGPSTGIPTKSEQTDLNIALYGLHGDAPHLVVAPNSIPDCLSATQWAVSLTEALQTPVIVLSDQSLGQTRAIIDPPPIGGPKAERMIPQADSDVPYSRYANTDSGISPMGIPGQPHSMYTATGLAHNAQGVPSSQASDHQQQLDKRARKLELYDFGPHWADISGDGPLAIITWGSSTAPVREALRRLKEPRTDIRLISIRLLAPAQREHMGEALRGVTKVLVVEQSHSAQFCRYLRAHYDLPPAIELFNRAGPLPLRPSEIQQRLTDWR